MPSVHTQPQTAAALADLPQGWFHHGPLILALLKEHRPQVVVELGSWKGASAVGMARLVRTWGGVVYCVDTWTPDAYHGGLSTDGVTFAATAREAPWMVATCAANLVAAGVSASVRLIPASTQDAAQYWQGPIDCLYIDADHTYAAVLADLEAWVPHVRLGGLILGDDYGNPAFPGVRMAWNYFAEDHDLTLSHGPAHPDIPTMHLIYGTV